VKAIAFSSLKGGVGKTTAALFTAEALANAGRRVIAVDTDPNNNLTDALARNESLETLEAHSLYHALTRRRPLADCVIPGKLNLALVPGTPSLARAGVELARDPGACLRFPMELKALDAEVIVIDTPPGLTIELTLALYAADLVIVPIGASRWSISAYEVIADELRAVQDATGRAVRILALPDIVTEREAETLRKIPGWTMTRSTIFKSASIRNATNRGKTLKDNGNAWTWYNDLAREVME
jgi:chromosome partitioning protein